MEITFILLYLYLFAPAAESETLQNGHSSNGIGKPNLMDLKNKMNLKGPWRNKGKTLNSLLLAGNPSEYQISYYSYLIIVPLYKV